MDARQIARLTELLALPTAPFRERHVVSHVSACLDRAGVPYFTDPIGNVIAGAGSLREYAQILGRAQGGPLRMFIAHMDHPGYHGSRWLSAARLLVRWHGGSPIKHLRGAKMRIVDDSGILGVGRLRKAYKHATGWRIETAEIDIPPDMFRGRRRPPAQTLFGGFAFRAPVWQSGGRLYSSAADDLIGVFAVIETARLLWKTRDGRGDFLGLLTRAEEVGFVGAVGHLDLGWLAKRRRTLVPISLEASRTLPGAQIGKGPIVRLGDRRTVFAPDGLRVLSEAAQKALKDAHQRRVMDGGSCEATAMTAWGLPAIGISVPLGNYHNQGFEGGPDCEAAEGPAPEFVSLSDVDGLLRLCRALMRKDLPWEDPWGRQRKALLDTLYRYRQLL
jgi:putative aminopeptidase FrvX